MPRIIPVIDVMNGVVVHAIGGRRETYQPIQSTIVDSTEPNKVAEAMLAKTGSNEIYVADLDAIRGAGIPSTSILRLIEELSATVWLDHGIRNGDETPFQLLNRENVNIIVGTETAFGPAAIERMLQTLPVQRIIPSIDLCKQCLLGPFEKWGVENSIDGRKMIKRVTNIGVKKLIILDLNDIGRKRGSKTLHFCQYAKTLQPDLRIITGGGVHAKIELDRVEQFHVDSVLVSTAIHAGELP